jgi:putative transposase
VPRRLRVEIAGGLFHITARGNSRAGLFLDAYDYAAFIRILGRATEHFGWRCLAFCLMPNHYHLLIETPAANRGAGMRHVNGSYAQAFNSRYDRSGHVFQGPYRATTVERDSHLLEVCRYVVLNPVRADLCARPGDWQWSSYRATAGLEAPPGFLTLSDVLCLFGLGPRAVRRYRAFVARGLVASDMATDRVPDMATDPVPGVATGTAVRS